MDQPLLFARDARILVVGDVMLDGYANGGVERISPEAPVPVLRHLGHHEVPGGAANVAMNLAALGARPRLVSVVGDDDDGRRLDALLRAGGVEPRLAVAADRPTTSKLRILAGHHQLLRIDKEDLGPLGGRCEAAVIEAMADALADVQAVILSDYCKGCLTDAVLRETIGRARELGLPVFVDPKRVDFAAYAGASFLTPNRSELSKATAAVCDDDASCRRGARMATEVTGADILLTRSEHGMSLFQASGEEFLLPTEAQEVFDVSGAGDTVVAAFALGIVSGHAPSQALRIANCAAGLVIAKAGTATTTERDVAYALERGHHQPFARGGLMAPATARRIREIWRHEKLIVGFTNGCFDLLHPGHVALLREAARQCDRLIVAINSDASVQRLKGPTRPIQTEEARAEVMGAIAHVDMVVIFDEDTPLQLIELLQPDLLVKGSDYAEDQIVGADVVRAAGGRVARVDLRAGHSTTRIVERSRGPELAVA